MIYLDMIKYWARMAAGKSYWNQAQGLGRHFVPGQLLGYFNDMTAKTVWEEEVDENDNPVSVFAGVKVNWPSTVMQKGLGHWDLWIDNGRSSMAHWNGFHNSVQWSVQNQEAGGGWRHPIPLHPHATSRYSCISQGEGASLLVRAYSQSGNQQYLQAAQKAIVTMLVPLANGGTANYVGDFIVFEEFPMNPQRTVLNGWIFALYGLYDFHLATGDPNIAQALDAALRGLMAYLPRYDGGYWSLYDLAGSIASPFYQQLHIAQLEALALTFPTYANEITPLRERFIRQSASHFNATRAMTVKVAQKMLRPPSLVQQTGKLRVSPNIPL